MPTRIQRIRARRARQEAGLTGSALLVDAEANRQRKFYAADTDAAIALAFAAARRAQAKLIAQGFWVEDRFAVWSQGVCYSVPVEG